VSVLPLILLYGLTTTRDAVHAAQAAPTWPGQRKFPAAKRARKAARTPGLPRVPAMPPLPGSRAHVKHAHPSHHVPPIQASTVAPHHDDSSTHLHDLHAAPPEPEHTQAEPSAPTAHVHVPAAAHVETHHASVPGDVSVAAAQRILVGLGWRGAGTTKGPVQASLTDGLFGPATAGNWAQSARKRGLDPMFARLGPKSAHVNPATYAKLAALAEPNSVVGVRIP